MFPDYLSDSYDYNLSKEKIQSKNNRKGKSFSQKSLLHEKYEFTRMVRIDLLIQIVNFTTINLHTDQQILRTMVRIN